MTRAALAAVLAGAALLATGCPDTAHPKIGSTCTREGRQSQTDAGTAVVCTGGVWRVR